MQATAATTLRGALDLAKQNDHSQLDRLGVEKATTALQASPNLVQDLGTLCSSQHNPVFSAACKMTLECLMQIVTSSTPSPQDQHLAQQLCHHVGQSLIGHQVTLCEGNDFKNPGSVKRLLFAANQLAAKLRVKNPASDDPNASHCGAQALATAILTSGAGHDFVALFAHISALAHEHADLKHMNEILRRCSIILGAIGLAALRQSPETQYNLLVSCLTRAGEVALGEGATGFLCSQGHCYALGALHSMTSMLNDISFFVTDTQGDQHLESVTRSMLMWLPGLADILGVNGDLEIAVASLSSVLPLETFATQDGAFSKRALHSPSWHMWWHSALRVLNHRNYSHDPDATVSTLLSALAVPNTLAKERLAAVFVTLGTKMDRLDQIGLIIDLFDVMEEATCRKGRALEEEEDNTELSRQGIQRDSQGILRTIIRFLVADLPAELRQGASWVNHLCTSIPPDYSGEWSLEAVRWVQCLMVTLPPDTLPPNVLDGCHRAAMSLALPSSARNADEESGEEVVRTRLSGEVADPVVPNYDLLVTLAQFQYAPLTDADALRLWNGRSPITSHPERSLQLMQWFSEWLGRGRCDASALNQILEPMFADFVLLRAALPSLLQPQWSDIGCALLRGLGGREPEPSGWAAVQNVCDRLTGMETTGEGCTISSLSATLDAVLDFGTKYQDVLPVTLHDALHDGFDFKGKVAEEHAKQAAAQVDPEADATLQTAASEPCALDPKTESVVGDQWLKQFQLEADKEPEGPAAAAAKMSCFMASLEALNSTFQQMGISASSGSQSEDETHSQRSKRNRHNEEQILECMDDVENAMVRIQQCLDQMRGDPEQHHQLREHAQANLQQLMVNAFPQ